jgi:dihydrofolate reductase
MRKIINSTYITLDGVIEDPQDWPSLGVDDASGVIQTELLYACDALVMGRRTYEGFAPVWPTRSGDPFSDHINSMPKYVVSSTLKDPEWANTTVITGDPVEELRRLKEEPGQNIVQYGFGQLSYAMLENGLLDEVRLWMHPFFYRGRGPEDLIFCPGAVAKMTLKDVRTLVSGMVILTYQPVK